MIAGTYAKPGGPTRTVAGIEIAMADGWKTYWRNPGDAGGVPPYFDWAGSDNLASAKVLFPAPSRLKDASGDSVGYKKTVVFPVEVTAKDPMKPVTLNLAMEFGVCREICVPAEAKFSITLQAAGSQLPAGLATALERVPRKAADRRPADPELKATRATLTGDKPKLAVDVAFTGDGAGADVFIEAPDGVYLSLPKKSQSATAGVQTFEVDLATGVDIAEIKGKAVVVTMVSAAGQSEATWKID
ncbi:MAG: protein-disulfide reductase DsbD domain-containing protein [Hyphomicrobiaceae bacterium]